MFAYAGTTSHSGFVEIVQTQTGETLYQSIHEATGFTSLSWSPDSRYIALGGYDQRIWVVDTQTSQIITNLFGHQSTVSRVDWSPDGTKLVSAGNWDGLTILWNMQTFQMERIVERNNLFVTSAQFDPSGQRIAIASESGITIYSTDIADQAPTAYVAQFNVASMEFSHDGSTIALGTQVFPNIVRPEATVSSQVVIVNSLDGTIQSTISTETATINGLAWSMDNLEIATHSSDGIVQMWNLATQTVVARYQGIQRYPGNVSFSPFGGRLAFGRSVLQGNTISSLEQRSIITENRANALYNIVVPAPSPERLQAITDACGLAPAADTALTAEISTQDYAGFTTQLEALPEDALPPGCRADLLAVAAALDAQGR
jgi:WD40 repeat protein